MRLEFELAYYYFAVQHICYKTMGTPSLIFIMDVVSENKREYVRPPSRKQTKKKGLKKKVFKNKRRRIQKEFFNLVADSEQKRERKKKIKYFFAVPTHKK